MSPFQQTLEQLFGIDSNTSATILITIIVFAIGQFSIGSVRVFRKWQQRRLIKHIFLESCSDLCESILRQAKSFNKLRETVQLSGGLRVTQHSHPALGYFSEPGKMEVYTAFMLNGGILSCRKRLKRKALRKIWSSIEGLEFIQSKNFEIANEYMVRRNKENTDRNQSLERLGPIILEYLVSLDGKAVALTTKTFADELQRIWNNWIELKNNNDPSISQNNLVEPILRLTTKHFRIEKSRELQLILAPAKTSFDAMEFFTNQYKDQLRIFEMDLIHQRRRIMKSADILT